MRESGRHSTEESDMPMELYDTTNLSQERRCSGVAASCLEVVVEGRCCSSGCSGSVCGAVAAEVVTQENCTGIISHCVSDEDVEEVTLPKSNLLGRFDLCDEQSAVNKSNQQGSNKASQSGQHEDANNDDMCDTTAPKAHPDKAVNGSSGSASSFSVNSNSPTGVDDLDAEAQPLTANNNSKLTNNEVLSDDEVTNPAADTVQQQQVANKSTTDTAGATLVEDPNTATTTSALVAAAKTNSSSPELIPLPAMLRLNDFHLHPELSLYLSQPCINRVAFYGIIHDVNKEATEMAKEDHSAFHSIQMKLSTSPELEQVPSATSSSTISSTAISSALIDEEEWLLTAIASRNDDECQRTLQDQLSQSSSHTGYRLGGSDNFAYACGEKDSKEPPTVESLYDSTASTTGSTMGPINEYGDNPNPVVTMNSSSRTQLWKPSRSWWEARSGKNPWIDPKNHVKRWRYLWPLIHYHKFLAKCIKKLKRHGFTDFLDPHASTVISFLRYEICAISNHLAACSRFDSDQWLSALRHFEGWNDTSDEAQEVVRVLVERQKLRSFAECRDLQSSPLLRKVMESVVANSGVGSLHSDGEERDSVGGAPSSVGYDSGKGGGPGVVKPGWKPYPVDPAALQGYSMSYEQPLYGYYNPRQLYPYHAEGAMHVQPMMGPPRPPRRAAPFRSMRGGRGRGYPPQPYHGARYGMDQYGMGYYAPGATMVPQYPPPGFATYSTDYSFDQASLHSDHSGQTQGHQFDESTATEEDGSTSRRDVASTPSKKSTGHSVAGHRSPSHMQGTPSHSFIQSPAHSVPPSPFWNNFANQVVDYVCESPFVPRGPSQHRMTPCHHLSSASQEEGGNVLFYNNFYQFGGVQPSPATQFVSSMSPQGSAAFFTGSVPTEENQASAYPDHFGRSLASRQHAVESTYCTNYPSGTE